MKKTTRKLIQPFLVWENLEGLTPIQKVIVVFLTPIVALLWYERCLSKREYKYEN